MRAFYFHKKSFKTVFDFCNLVDVLNTASSIGEGIMEPELFKKIVGEIMTFRVKHSMDLLKNIPDFA